VASKLIIDEREFGDVTVLTLRGQILLDDGDLVFRKKIHELVDSGRVKIVVNLAEVDYIDSAGIGMIVGKLKTVRERSGDMKLLNLNTRGQRVFGITKLVFVFETFDNERARRQELRVGILTLQVIHQQVFEEPASRQLRHLVERARLFEEVRGVLDEDQLSASPHARHRLAVQANHFFVTRPDHEQCWRGNALE
jgi:anti-sigma B factor antagonist